MRRTQNRTARSYTSFILLLLLCALVVGIFGLLKRQPNTEPAPEKALQAAWRAAEASDRSRGRQEFRTIF